MDKLELKYILPYVPFDVNVKVGRISKAILTLNNTGADHISVRQVLTNPKGWQLILRPLSELADTSKSWMEQLNELQTLDYDEEIGFIDEVSHGFDCQWLSYAVFVKLLEWHFDVFSLIEQGLAIDINTLNEEDHG